MVRDAHGRFRPGCPPGPGRPPASTEAEYAEAIRDVVTVDRWRKVIEAALAKAERGDLRAITFLASHLIGPPAPVVPVVALGQEYAGEMSREEKVDAIMRELKGAARR